MPELTGLDLIREFVAVDARRRAAADPDDDGARHRRERARGDEARRARLPAEAVRDRRAAGRGRAARSSTSGCAPSTATCSASATSEFNHYGIVGRSRAMQDVIKRAELVAETKSTVLITGETGTGKELVARAIHDRSAQRDMPLITVNCAALPETLLESRAVRPRARRVHRRDRRPSRASSRWPTAARSSSTRSAR